MTNFILQILTFGIPFLVGIEILPLAAIIGSLITAYMTAVVGEANRLEQDEFRDNSDGKVFETLSEKGYRSSNSTIGVSLAIRLALMFGAYWIGTLL